MGHYHILITSTLRRLPASSKEVRLRVLGSTNRWTTVLPCSVGTFFNPRKFWKFKVSEVDGWARSGATDDADAHAKDVQGKA